MTRDLALDTHLIPKRPLEWSSDELDQLRRHIETTGQWDAKVARRWECEIDYRKEQQEFLIYPGRYANPHVLRELPLLVLAYRAVFDAPELALASDRFGAALQRLRETTLRPSRAAAARLRALADRLYQRSHNRYLSYRITGGNATEDGLNYLGLAVETRGDQVRLLIHREHVATVPANDGITPILRALFVAWRHFVRVATSVALLHAIDPPSHRTLDSRLRLALPSPIGKSVFELLADGRLREQSLLTLPGASFSADADERRVVARKILSVLTSPSFVGDRTAVLAAVDAAVDNAMRRLDPPFQPLRPAPESPESVLSRLDDVGRAAIAAFAEGRHTTVDDPAANRFDVRVGHGFSRRLLASVSSLALAIDLERSNRKPPGIDIALSIGPSGAINYVPNT